MFITNKNFAKWKGEGELIFASPRLTDFGLTNPTQERTCTVGLRSKAMVDGRIRVGLHGSTFGKTGAA
ncbi:MAG: hypothetical protein P8N76_09750 [Pirellulaceae bacterium]|nr:hypothetical protein [Pirellulaceae bacterium]